MLGHDPDLDIARSRDPVLVNTVNTRGVMGAGVARAVRQAWPGVMPPYVRACESGLFRPGTLHLHQVPGGPLIVNMATKDDWRDPSRPVWVGAGLLFLNRVLLDRRSRDPNAVSAVTLPPPGCGHGGLDRDIVEGMMRALLQPSLAAGIRITVTDAPGRIPDRPIFHAGVGARATPDEVLRVMSGLSGRLEEMGIRLRSGGARGADQAFEAGLRRPDRAEIYRLGPDTDSLDPVFNRIARAFHPKPRALSGKVLALMTRNGAQIFGRDFIAPSDIVLCWTPGGEGGGGTGQAIRLARGAGIPVIDLGQPEYRDLDVDRLRDLALDGIAARRRDIGLPPPALPRVEAPVRKECGPAAGKDTPCEMAP